MKYGGTLLAVTDTAERTMFPVEFVKQFLL